MRTFRGLLISLLFFFLLTILPQAVFAQEPVRDGAGCSATEINTAIGCVPVLDTNNTAFMSFIVKWGGGIAGFVAFLLFSYGSFMVMTSSGNPQRVQAGKELITSALMGLVLLVSSAFLLRFIGIDILGLFD